jgi:hypothetical protein
MNRVRVFQLSGATAVTSIPAFPTHTGSDAWQFGDRVILLATAASQSVVKGNNLLLRSDWTSTAAGDFLEVLCDGTNWIELGRKPAGYQVVRDRGGQMTSLAAAPRVLLSDGIATSTSLIGRGSFVLKASRLPSSRLLVSFSVESNSTDSTATFTAGLYPLTSPTGGAGAVANTIGTVVTGSTVALTPGANGDVSGESGEFTVPADGRYGLAVVISTNMAASADVVARALLLSRIA